MQLYQMRGMQLGCVYWLLAAIYLFAALGSVVASGNALPVQLAVSAPALLVAGPVAVGRAAECATEAAIDAVIGESKEWEDVVAAWCEGFMADAREEEGYAREEAGGGFGDRRGSNGHRRKKKSLNSAPN